MRGKEHRGRAPLASLALGLLLAATLGGCSPDPQPLLLWEGHGFSWDLLSHRISYLRAGVAPGEGPGEVDAQLGIIGGPWSTGDVLVDQPSYRLRWRSLESRHIRVAYREWAMTVPPEGRVEEQVSLPFTELGFLGQGLHVAVLQGIEWDTGIPQSEDFPADYDPSDGWTPQGFGAGVEELGVSDEGIDLRIWSHFKPGPLDRDDMNAAVPFARIGAVVRFAVIELSPTASAVLTPGEVEAAAYYVVDPPNTLHPPIDEADRTVGIQGEPGLAAGIPVFRSWDFELNLSLDEEGRYLREFAAGIESFSYEAAEGNAEVTMDAFVSISSLFEEGDLDVQFTGGVALLQWDEEDVANQQDLLEGSSETLGAFDRVVSAP